MNTIIPPGVIVALCACTLYIGRRIEITKAVIDHKVRIAIFKFNMEVHGGQTITQIWWKEAYYLHVCWMHTALKTNSYIRVNVNNLR